MSSYMKELLAKYYAAQAALVCLVDEYTAFDGEGHEESKRQALKSMDNVLEHIRGQ